LGGPEARAPSLDRINTNKARNICHVLIIEDEALVAMDIQSVLIEAGATSFAFASTEAEAVEQACGCRPLVMTSDVRLTIGTGPAAVRVIRDRLGMIPCLFVSGTPADCHPREPADAVFSKPFDRAGLAMAFGEILREGGGAVSKLRQR
jgi:CheY-like chemotaxis protein